MQWRVKCVKASTSDHLKSFKIELQYKFYTFWTKKKKKPTGVKMYKTLYIYFHELQYPCKYTRYCSSFIIILLISSLSYVRLPSQLSLSHFITTLSFSHLNSAKPISFSFFLKISGFEDEDDDSSAEISRATDWVRSVSLGGKWVGNADQPLRSNNPFGNGDGDEELIGHGGRVG